MRNPTRTVGPSTHSSGLLFFGFLALLLSVAAISCSPNGDDTVGWVLDRVDEEDAPENEGTSERVGIAKSPGAKVRPDKEAGSVATEPQGPKPAVQVEMGPVQDAVSEAEAPMRTGGSSELTLPAGMAGALKGVNAQVPERFQEIVTPLPEVEQFEEIETDELLKMLENWNPSLREAAAKALGARGEKSIPDLVEASQSKQASVQAGAASALGAIIKQKLRNWKEHYPDAKNSGQAQEEIREDHADLADVFVRLAKNPELEVRVAAMEGLKTLAPQTPEAVEAVLDLCMDENEYLAQDAMVAINRTFSLEAIQEERVIAVFKEALRSPLPNGKGHIIHAIHRMDEKMQRNFIPDLLAHLDWQPRRDTMFGGGGQANSIQILTKLEVQELIPRLPGLMDKPMRGPGLFMPCLESAQAFGRDAKAILPELRSKLAELKQGDAQKRQDHEERVNKLEETVAFLEKR
jgi:hypothetical protein